MSKLSFLLFVGLLFPIFTTGNNNDPSSTSLISCPSKITNVVTDRDIDYIDPHVVRDWNELSGLAVSPYQKGPSGSPVVWGHNDGRDQAKNGTNFAAWDSGTGERLLTFHLMYSDTSNPPIYNQDWEDMTIGTCGGSDDDDEICLYFADTGDNGASCNDCLDKTIRPENRPYVIYKVKEPVLEDFYPSVVAQLDTETYVTTLTIDYLDETSPFKTRDVEAVFLDHAGWGEGGQKGDIYLVTLGRQDAKLYKIPANVWPTWEERTAHYSPKVVGGTDKYREGLEYTMYVWRGSEMSWDGTKIILGNIHRNFVFLRCPGQSVVDALVGPDACMIFDNPPEAADTFKQFEAVAWFNDGGYNILNVAEIRTGTMAPKLVQTTFDYSNPGLNGFCPPVKYVDNGSGGQVCKVVSTDDGITFTRLVGQTRPDTWCDAYSEYYATPSPTMAPSIKSDESSSDPPTLRPTPDYFADFDDDKSSGGSAAATTTTTFIIAVILSSSSLIMILSSSIL